MSIDYKDIKKGLKRKEYDEMKYHGYIIWAIIAGVVVGCLTKMWVVGVIVFGIIAVIGAKRYFEI